MTYKPAVGKGALVSEGHYRLTFKGWKTAVLVMLDEDSQGFWVGPAKTTYKKMPASISRRGKKATLDELTHVVGLFKKRYLKAYPVIAQGPTVRQVLNAAYYGAPLRDVYYK